jgi:glycosyltransferase involved in cell wall biosynthesis
MALASLLAQTYQSWECVFVDDGSTDGPERVVKGAKDGRIRYFRLDRNVGRGGSHQLALERSKGDFIAILDADDWYYPWKLERQIEALRGENRVGLLSAGMAIVDAGNRLVGVRCSSGDDKITFGPLAGLAQAPLAFGPCMLRRDIALKAGFDRSFRSAQDADFLLRIVLENSYCTLPDVMYVYTEYQSVTLKKILASHCAVRRMFWKHRGRFPVASSMRIGESLSKSAAYRVGFACGQGERFVQRRSKPPTEPQRLEFQKAQAVVLATVRRVFGSNAVGEGTEAARNGAIA